MITTLINVKHDNLEGQFKRLDPRLQAIVFWLSSFFKDKCDKELVITCIFRTQNEQDKCYKLGFTTESKSPHQSWRAIDIRTRDLDEEQKRYIVEVINYYWQRKDGYPTALIHGEKDNEHLHLQCSQLKDILN